MSGSLTLGIGTQANNTPASVTTYAADPNSGEFVTTYANVATPSFLDSGSNGIFFPAPASLIPVCANNTVVAGLFCPTSPVSLSATISDYTSKVSIPISFHITSASAFVNAGFSVSDGMGAPASGIFDWGLPFFYGRTIFVGIDGTQSSLGAGPYWAF